MNIKWTTYQVCFLWVLGGVGRVEGRFPQCHDRCGWNHPERDVPQGHLVFHSWFESGTTGAGDGFALRCSEDKPCRQIRAWSLRWPGWWPKWKHPPPTIVLRETALIGMLFYGIRRYGLRVTHPVGCRNHSPHSSAHKTSNPSDICSGYRAVAVTDTAWDRFRN